MKIAFAIPTYNRLSRLQVAIESIRAQERPPGLEIELVISNSASTDGTTEYIDSLKNGQIELPVHCWNQVDHGTGADNWRRVAQAVPEDVDWVWFLGDDDYIVDPRACWTISLLLQDPTNADVHFVHASQARRASAEGSTSIVKGTCFELCNRYGYHELMGWMSSLFVKRKIFCEALIAVLPPGCDGTKLSAFVHSAAIFERLAAEQMLFVDAPLVEPQDLAQTEESISRWAVENVGGRYFYVLDDFRSLYDRGVVPSGYSKTFFRYLTYSLWDRLAAQLIGEVVKNESIDDDAIGKFKRLEGVINTLADPVEKKMMSEWIASLGATLSEFAVAIATLRRQKQALVRQFERLQAPVYDFQINIVRDGQIGDSEKCGGN